MVQRKCKSNTIKLAWIAEVQPFLSKDTRNKIVEVKVDGLPASCQNDPKEATHLPEQSWHILIFPEDRLEIFKQLVRNE